MTLDDLIAKLTQLRSLIRGSQVEITVWHNKTVFNFSPFTINLDSFEAMTTAEGNVSLRLDIRSTEE